MAEGLSSELSGVYLHPPSLMWLAERRPSLFYLNTISSSTLDIHFILHLVVPGSDQKGRV
jgi:hypothetical protein